MKALKLLAPAPSPTAEINHIAREMKVKDDQETERVGPIDAPEGVKAA